MPAGPGTAPTIPTLRRLNARTPIRLNEYGRVRKAVVAPAAEAAPGIFLPRFPGRRDAGGPMVSTRSAGVKGTKGLVAFTIVSFLASLFFLAGALSHPGTGTLWAASIVWAATGVLAAVRVGVRRRIVAAAAARTVPAMAVRDVRESLIIRFTYGLADPEPLFRMDEELDRVVEASGAGEYDGHEIAVDLSDGSLYFYGPSAAEIRELIAPTWPRIRL